MLIATISTHVKRAGHENSPVQFRFKVIA